MSDYTKNCRRQLWLFRILDFLCLVAPMFIYVTMALLDKSIGTTEKFTCSGLVIVALILTVFNVIAAKRLTCIKWIVMLGIFVAFKHMIEVILPLMIIMVITTSLDDFLFQSVIAHYKTKLEASKVYDERLIEESLK